MNTGSENGRGLGREARTSAPDRHWKVFFLGDHGRVIAFKRIKALIWLTIGVIAAALLAVVVLVVVNARLHARTQALQERLSTAQLQIQALREERDRLTAQVVLVETKMKETLAGVRRRPMEAPPNPVGAEKPADRSASAPAEAVAAKAPAPPEPTEDARNRDGTGESVAVESFHAGFDPARRALELRYRLAAARPGRKPLAGHVIVVFRGEGIEPDRWLAMPRVDLPNGRPSGRQKGYTFSISHSKAFAHSMAVPASLPAYTQAVMYVFSTEGQLWLARDYGVDVRPSGG